MARLAGRARHALDRLAGREPHLQRVAGREALQLELRPHPRHRTAQTGDIEDVDHWGTVAAGMGRLSYLILHGYQGSGPGHWQTWLAGRLRATDAQVAYPDLPDADQPQLRSWLDALARELDALPSAPVVLCHSLACLLWLHHSAGGGSPAARVLMVAPPSRTG